MPKLSTLQSNFSAGEMSPKLFGHTDLQRYQNAAKTLENVVPLVYGGVRRRHGSRFCDVTRDSTLPTRLIPYVVNRELSYMIALSPSFMQFYRRDGFRIGYEINTPYDASMLWDVDYVQGADMMYLAHPLVPIQRLRRFADDNWYLGVPPFTTTPFDEIGRKPAFGLSFDNITVGLGRNAFTALPFFLESDVGRAIVVDSGIAVITAVPAADHAIVTINAPFRAMFYAPQTWNLDASPMATLTFSTAKPVGTLITFALDKPGFRGDEAGQFIRANEGLIRIGAIGDAQNGNGTLITELSSVTEAPPLAWSLNSSVWGGLNGYPRTVSLYEQRLMAGGSIKDPQTVWGSRSGEPLDFTSGTLDDEAFSFTIQADEVNPISFLASGRALLCLTYGGEFSISGGVEKPIAPTSVQIKPQSPFGALGVRPINVGKELMFVQRAARKIRAMTYQYTQDGYVAPDITVLAEHITESGLRDLCYQQEPDQVIWAVRNDGTLISCTIDRDQDVIAWARHRTDGVYESIAAIPGERGDDLWCIARRNVGGVEQRFVERFESSWLPYAGSPKDWGFTLDSAIAYDVAGQAVFGGLGHLEGKTVAAVADGSAMGSFVVAGGQITLPRVAKKVLIGLRFTPLVETLRPEVATGTGTAQGSAMRFNRIVARFHETIGAKINGEVLAFRQFGAELLDHPLEPFSGDHPITNLGWETGDAPIVITQDDPLPFHLLAIIKSMTVNQS